ncbi:hypothetical protein D3C81_975000 [compost metagenome]
MTFGREVDDPARAVQLINSSDVDLTCNDFTCFASRRVQTVVLRKALLEHQCDAFAHDTHSIHCVDEGFGPGFQQVALSKSDHWKYHPGRA